MERSPFTDTHTSHSDSTEDVTQRLQNVIANWQGAANGYSLEQLYQDSKNIVGTQKQLLPRQILYVANLNSNTLEQNLHRQINYRSAPVGNFESVLVPIVQDGSTEAYFILVLEKNLSTQDQVALFAHAVSHLILNYQRAQIGTFPNLDPLSNMAHVDKLLELRYFDAFSIRNRADRDVLQNFPDLAQLIAAPEESDATAKLHTEELSKALQKKQWDPRYVKMSYRYTAGRVIPDSSRRGPSHSIDALLRIAPSLPAAIVHTQRPEEKVEDSLRIIRNAAQQLSVPFAYVLTKNGDVLEYDWTNEPDVALNFCSELPDREELQRRWFAALHITNDAKAIGALTYPFHTAKLPRYYQEAAINQAVIATLQARQGQRSKRILLTLATGTGKTLVAFQLLWKLKRTYEIRNVLFLADRGNLLNQAQSNAFGPFNEAIRRGMGKIDTTHDMLFGTYQWLTNLQNGKPAYMGYPADYFDVIVVDECHRGSADEDSNWHQVLAHFSGAVQIGLTATPLATKEINTNEYFGPSVYTYSLSRGINDGYLAPYRVRYVQIGHASGKQTNEQQQDTLPESEQDTPVIIPELPDIEPQHEPAAVLAQDIVVQTSETMRQSTQVIAEHLANYLHEQGNPRAKTIVFCVDNAHAGQMRDAISQACDGWIKPTDIVRIVDDDGLEGQRALETFRTPREPHPIVVTTSRLLSTGVDVPTCQNVVLARGVGSIVEFKQIIGRGTRIFEPEKTWFTVIDYSGAIKHFFDPNFDGDPVRVQNDVLVIKPDSQTGNDTGEATEVTPEDQYEPIQAPKQAQGGSTQPKDLTNEQQGTSEQRQHQYNSIDQTRNVQESGLPLAGTHTDNTQQMTGTASQNEQTEQQIFDNLTQDGQKLPNQHTTSEETETQPASQLMSAASNSGVPSSSSSARTPGKGTVHTIPEQEQTHEPEQPDSPPEGGSQVENKSGKRFIVSGDRIYELGPDGKTLRPKSTREFARQALRDRIKRPEDLQARWLSDIQRQEVLDILAQEVVGLDVLAKELNLTNVDPLDLLLHVLFQVPVLTRKERVERLRQKHTAFFQRFADSPLAGQILNAILEKYIQGDAPDVSAMGLLNTPPISNMGGTQLNRARAFSSGPNGMKANAALKELYRLLYSV